MHRIYETESLVLVASPSREADRQLSLYTREFGLLRATAQGIRELKSKLRYSVQPYSLSVVNLVRGRGGWRLTNARLLRDYYRQFSRDARRLLVLARVSSLLRRMVTGEEKHAELFDTIRGGLTFLETAPKESLPEAELVLVLRVLHHLGYVGESPALSTLLLSGPWGLDLLSAASRERRSVLHSVNESLKASQL